VDGLTASLEAHLDDLLKSLLADLEGVVAAMHQAGADRETRRQRLKTLDRRVKQLEQELGGEMEP
jgi:hypothetical protein